MRNMSERMQSRKFLLAVIIFLLAFVLYAIGRIEWDQFAWLVGPIIGLYIVGEALADAGRKP